MRTRCRVDASRRNAGCALRGPCTTAHSRYIAGADGECSAVPHRNSLRVRWAVGGLVEACDLRVLCARGGGPGLASPLCSWAHPTTDMNNREPGSRAVIIRDLEESS